MSDISALVKCAAKTEHADCDDVSLGKFPNYLAQKILELTGVRLHGVEKILSAHAIRHTIKGHGNDKSERERGQIGMTHEDFDLIPKILKASDEILKGSIERGRQSLLFKKRFKCEYFVAMIIEGKALVLRTMYKKP